MNNRGNVYLVFGKRNTGKSFESLQFGEVFRTREIAPKRVIVYDWTKNDDTYGHIKLIHHQNLKVAALPKRALVKVQCGLNEFLDSTEKIVNAVILIDDGTTLFQGNVPERVQKFFGTAKNNRLEIIVQVHSIADTGPKLLREANIWILKQTHDSRPLKESCRSRQMVENILDEIKEENREFPSDQKWSTRLIDWDEEKIFIKDLDNQEEHLGYIEYKEFEEYL